MQAIPAPLAIGRRVPGATAYSTLYADSAGALGQVSGLTFGGAAAGTGLNIPAGTATTAVSPLAVTQTWNNAGVTFPGFKLTITDTASAAGSLAFQVLGGAAGTTNLISVDKTGKTSIDSSTAGNTFRLGGSQNPAFALISNASSSSARNWGFVCNQNAFGDFVIRVSTAKGGEPSTSVIACLSSGNVGLGTTNPAHLLSLASAGVLGWETSAGSDDFGISRISAGLAGIGTGAAGSFAGALKLTKMVVASGGTTLGDATTAGTVKKSITAIADNTATPTFTVTVPNGAHSASIKLTLKGSLGAGGAIGANEATGSISYDIAIARTAGVATVVGVSTAYGSSTAAVAGGATITITAAASGLTGANNAQQTFTIDVTIARGSGASANHTCGCFATIINANASGVTLT